MATVKDEIIDSLKAHALKDPEFFEKKRITLHLPLDKAFDLLRLGQNDLGSWYQEFLEFGVEDLLRGKKMFGAEIRVDRAGRAIRVE